MKNVVAALSIVALAGTTFGQEVPGSVALRFLDTENLASSMTIDTTSLTGPVELEFYVQASLLGDPNASDLATVEFLIDDGGDAGTLSAAELTITDATGLPFPGMDIEGRIGMFPRYRTFIGGNNAAESNGSPMPGGELYLLPLNISDDGALANEAWDNVFRLRWTTNDLSDRTVSLSTISTLGGYFSTTDGLQQPAPVIDGTFDITFIPAPGTAVLACTGVGFATLRRRRR